MGRKKELITEISKIRTSKKITVNEDSFEDFNPLDVMPDIIDKDYGFFLMFGNPDKKIYGKKMLEPQL